VVEVKRREGSTLQPSVFNEKEGEGEKKGEHATVLIAWWGMFFFLSALIHDD
jgi:hypothetical protein